MVGSFVGTTYTDVVPTSNLAARSLYVVGLCSWYIAISGGLIYFNKYLMNKDRFPHAMPLTFCHMSMSLALASIGYCINPAAYPGMERTKGKRMEVFKVIVPIGVLFAVMLVGSNMAYMYAGVAFLQFMKEANVAVVFMFSCIAGTQVMNRQRFVVIIWIILGSSVCVHGGLNFVLAGFLLQGMSQICECARAVLAEKLLTDADTKLDPFTYTLFTAPVCLLALGMGTIITWNANILHDFQIWWPCLLPNACMAFLLNLTVAKLIKEVSAVGFIMAGIVKDIFLVVIAAVYAHEQLVPLQWSSFVVTVSGVFFWSYMKVMPDAPAVTFFERILGVEKHEGEETPLIVTKS